ncbi:proline racemase family protein [Shouchella lonarensis]|uniref:Proline racemase n=1 Tax=Shouchella lonarensis TaxID=1464122 RepID=A0A1G6JSQ0_9BACI|nr:proline racemase family protein [Shouchella lonarensis]SDC21754.1 proline racemase [Shouchella lonarensis]
MNIDQLVTTIDTHTGGNPTRTILSGAPKLQGQTMSERMLDMKANHDWFRQALMNEPRGHSVMSGVVLQDPCHPDADIGAIFIETGGYLPMCGHDTIGCATALIEAGLVDDEGSETKIVFDTPAGLVPVEIDVRAGRARAVSFCNVPSFHYKQITLDVAEFGLLTIDIAYGGNFYGIISAEEAGLVMDPKNTQPLIDAAIRIRQAVNASETIVHSENRFISGLTHIEFYGEPTHPHADVKNTVIVPPGGIDRSPCGTGTSAKMATLFTEGKLNIGQTFVHESIVGSVFYGEVLKQVQVGAHVGVVNKIKGQAYVTGHHQFLLSKEDPLRDGFLLVPEMEAHGGDGS